jgi:hypothetical protein
LLPATTPYGSVASQPGIPTTGLQLGKDKPGGVKAMNELAETGVSGIIVPDDHELEKWRVYFQGRLTAPRFSSRTDAMGYLGVLRSGNRKPEFALAYEGKEIR